MNSEWGPVFYLWSDYFGSCSVCDRWQALSDSIPYNDEYTEKVVTEKDKRQAWEMARSTLTTPRLFWSLDEMAAFVEEMKQESFELSGLPDSLIDDARKAFARSI